MVTATKKPNEPLRHVRFWQSFVRSFVRSFFLQQTLFSPWQTRAATRDTLVPSSTLPKNEAVWQPWTKGTERWLARREIVPLGCWKYNNPTMDGNRLPLRSSDISPFPPQLRFIGIVFRTES